MTNCTAHLNPVIPQQRLLLPPSLQYEVAAHWSVLCASRPKATIVMEKDHSKLQLPINKLSKLILILANGYSVVLFTYLFTLTWQQLHCSSTNQPAVFILVSGVGFWDKLLSEPQLVMFTIFIPLERKVRYNCDLFRWWALGGVHGLGAETCYFLLKTALMFSVSGRCETIQIKCCKPWRTINTY